MHRFHCLLLTLAPLAKFINMTSQFGDLTVEGFETVVNFLSLEDICSLRLTCRAIAVKSSQGRFKTLFIRKEINVNDSEQLQAFVHMTQTGNMGCLLQHLVVMDIAPDPSSIYAQQSTEVVDILLEQAFANLQRGLPRRTLQSLSLQVRDGAQFGTRDHSYLKSAAKGPDVSNWVEIWHTAGRLFHTTALALRSSALLVEELDVFGRVIRCSLACSQITSVLDSFNLSVSLAGLKRLSLSLSNCQTYDPEDASIQTYEIGTIHTKNVCRFLRLCPNLEELELQWYNLAWTPRTEASIEERHFFNRIAQFHPLASLKRCTLQGIYTTATDLINFLTHPSLSSMTMDHVRLEPGKWSLVFDKLLTHPLEFLHFDSLSEDRLIWFHAPGKPHYPTTGRRKTGPNVITRTGSDARKPIKYEVTQGRALDSPECTRFMRKTKELYGPPPPSPQSCTQPR